MVKKKKAGILPLVFLIVAIILYCSAANAETENLLYNGDFEILDADGLPDGWFTDAYQMEPGYSLYDVCDGMDGPESRAVKLKNTAKNDARFAQTVEVEPETVYCLSGYILAEQIEGGHGANLSVEGVYAFSEKLYDTEGKWQRIVYYGETGPDQYSITVFARVGGYSGESKGTACFDGLTLEKVDNVPEDVYPDLWFRPESANAGNNNVNGSGSDGDSAGPAWPWLLVIAALYAAAVVTVIYKYRDGKSNISGPETGKKAYLPILILSFLLRAVISYFIEGYSVDVNCFLSWGNTMLSAGPAGFYNQTSFCDYPPLYTYVLGFNSWLSGLVSAGQGWTRLIFRLIPSLCDVAACWILLKFPDDKIKKSRYYTSVILLLAFNPVSILNSAAWGQMDSVLCLLLLCTVLLAVRGKWIHAIAFYVTAVLVKPQALMLGFLGLAFMVIAIIKEKSEWKKILIGTVTGILLILIYVLPFGIHQEFGWLINRYSETLSSYPYATVNTANLYYLAGGNWSSIESAAQLAVPIFFACACIAHGAVRFLINRKEKHIYIDCIFSILFAGWFTGCAIAGAAWTYTGIGAMAYAFVIVLTLAFRSKNINFLPYLGALLFILLYVFGIKMHERYLFPAFLFLAFSWTIHKDRRILYLLLLFSMTVFVNEGIVLDNSIRFGSSLGHLNRDTVLLADVLSILNVAGAVYAVFLGYRLMKKREPGNLKTMPAVLPVRHVSSARRPEDYHPDRKIHWKWRDTVILCIIMASYSVVSLSTLGSTKAPQNAWTSSSEDEEIVFDLQDDQKDIRILYFAQVSRNDFTISQSNDGVNWSEEVYAQMDQGQCWKWKYVTLSYPDDEGGRTYYNNTESIHHFSGRYLRLRSGQVGLTLNEIIFRDAEGNSIPATIFTRTGDDPDSPLWSSPENLLDEQDSMENLPGFFGQIQEGETQPSWWNSTYFDEIYHARTGYEFTKGTVPYETTHPPLGKVFISWCISIFGMTPFGWRFAGAVAGILMLPGIYLLAKQLMKKTWPAAFACGLMALDCMHLTQTQIATIDSFPVLFIIFSYFFMLRFVQTDLTVCSVRKVLPSLLMSGISIGLAIASKWIGIYAGAGLAILFFWHCFRMIRLDRMNMQAVPDKTIRKVILICLWCILFFIMIPIAVYLLSYIPYMAYNTRIRSLGDFLNAVWRAQENMLNYHSTPGLGMDHPFYSPWWQWPIIGKPMFYATEQYISHDASFHHSIFSFGNPVVWWGALAALVMVITKLVLSRRYQIGEETIRWHRNSQNWNIDYEFVFIGLLAQYLPWVLVPRGTYIYHYFASIPFLILITALCLPDGSKKMCRYGFIFGGCYLIAAAVFFVILLPYTTGMASPASWLDIGKNILRIWY